MHEVLVNRLGGLSLPRKSVVRLTDRPDMTLDVYRGRKTIIQQYNNNNTSLITLTVIIFGVQIFSIYGKILGIIVLYQLLSECIFKVQCKSKYATLNSYIKQ